MADLEAGLLRVPDGIIIDVIFFHRRTGGFILWLLITHRRSKVNLVSQMFSKTYIIYKPETLSTLVHTRM